MPILILYLCVSIMFVFSIPFEVCEAVIPGFVLAESGEGSDASKAIKSAIRKMITKVIDSGVTIDKARKTVRHYRLRLPLPVKYTRSIKKLAKDIDASEPEICETLVDIAITQGLLTEVTTVDQDSTLVEYLDALKFKKRPPQLLFYEYLSNLGKGEIGIIEASTGVGKTLGLLSAACENVKADNSTAVIAVPSKALITQFESLYNKLSESLPLPALQVILGRNNFVAVNRLKQALVDDSNSELEEHLPDVKEWFDQLHGQTAYIDELAQITPMASAFSLGQYDKDDPSEEDYKNQFKPHKKACVILTTHAMVASHLLRLKLQESQIEGLAEIKAEHRVTLTSLFAELELFPKHSDEYKAVIAEINSLRESQGEVLVNALKDEVGLLPEFSSLYIDEAHTLDDSMNMIFNSVISLNGCFRALRKLADEGKATQTSFERAKLYFEKIKNIAGERLDDRIYFYDGSDKGNDAASLALQFASACLQGVKAAAKREDPTAKQLLADCNLIKRAKESVTKYHRQAYLEFSPIAKYPRISLRQRTLEREYGLLWGRLQKCALVSATLYTRQIAGESSQHIRKKMFISDGAAIDFTPIRPAWLTAPVVECLIPSENRQDLVPPGRRDKLSHKKLEQHENQFLESVAKELKSFVKQSAGGTLVLCTSYRAVEALADQLTINRDIIKASKNVSVTRQKEQFCQSSLKGNRPVWLALGAAWTGLDINGDEFGLKAKDDNLLTDLVIVKIPFANTEQNNSNPGFAVLEASLKFKQGLGRLVRREGLTKNRRVCVLDGRLSDPTMVAYTSIIKHMLSGYAIRKI